MKNKNRVLCVMQLPPPVHGVSMMNSVISESEFINERNLLDIFPLHYSRTFSEFTSGLSLRKIFRMFYYYLHFIERILLHRPKLVYFTLTPTGMAFVRDSVFVYIAKLFHVSVLLHLHGQGIRKSYISHPRLYKHVFLGTDVIVLSEKLKEDVSFLPLKKLYVLNNGIEGFEVSQHSVSCDDKRTDLRILYFSVVTKTKGIFDLLDALSLLSQHCDCSLTIVGPLGIGMCEDDLRQYIAEKRLCDRVDYKGAVYGDMKRDLFASNDIFVLPSHNDAFPLVLLEALSVGMPCISTRVGGIPDIIDDGETGFLYDAGDIAALSDLICLFQDKELLSKMSGRARAVFSARFTKRKFESTFCDILTTVLNGSR